MAEKMMTLRTMRRCRVLVRGAAPFAAMKVSSPGWRSLARFSVSRWAERPRKGDTESEAINGRRTAWLSGEGLYAMTHVLASPALPHPRVPFFSENEREIDGEMTENEREMGGEIAVLI